MKKLLLAIVSGMVVLAAIVFTRAACVRSVQVLAQPPEPIAIDPQLAAQHLSEALRFETISYGVPSPISKDAFLAFHTYLEETYPAAHSAMTRELVGGFSLLYEWKGSDASLDPILLMGHFDVVPVPPGSEREWKHPPFGGTIVDGIIWGRGAVDDKLNVIGALEAVDWLAAQGFKPKRTVYLSLGHDEEVGGGAGAKRIAAVLKERGIRFECAIDEGGLIMNGALPGLKPPVALVGIAEKGYLTVSLRAQHKGGHSSTPPANSAIGIVSQAVVRLEKHPFPGRLAGASRALFEAIGPEMDYRHRLVFSNLWLTRFVVEGILAGTPETNAMIRTTTAATMVEGGVKENVLPTEAKATVNFRIIPGETVDDVLKRVKETIRDDRVIVEPVQESANNPSAISDVNAASYHVLERTIRQVCPDVVVGPYLVLGATDSRHFAELTDNLYRFVPSRFNKGETSMMHGVNERISVDNFGEVVRFYVQVVRNFCGDSPS